MIRKLLLISLLFIAFLSNIQAQNLSFEWANTFGNSSYDQIIGSSIDPSGNLLTAGHFSGTVDFDPGAGVSNLTATGSYDVFIQKTSPTGDLIWVQSITTGSTNSVRSMGTDASGNVYLSGDFRNTVDFDPGVGVVNLTSANSDMFILKLNSSGNFVWVKQIGSTTASGRIMSMVSDASNNMYFTGWYANTLDFDPGVGTVNLISNGNADVFILKLDMNGNFTWAKSVGGTQRDQPYAIALDASNNVYITGEFFRTVDFDPGAGIANLTAANDVNNISKDGFILKLNSSGNYIWSKGITGTQDNFCQAITIGTAGNLYITGSFTGTADLDPGASAANVTAFFGKDMFVLKLNSAGSYVWGKTIRSISSPKGKDIVLDGFNNIYIVGSYGTATDMDPSSGSATLPTVGSFDDVFFLKWDSDGNYIWAKGIGGPSYLEAYSIDIDASGNIFTAGFFQETVDFDFGAATLNKTSAGGRDTFIMRLSPCTPGIPVADITSLPNITGQCSVAMPAAPTATNACGDGYIGTPDKAFPITAQGNTVVTWTFDDEEGNITTQTQTVIINDITTPVLDNASLPDLTNECSIAMPSIPTAIDNCLGTMQGVPNVSFPITAQGTTVITWTFNDGNDNTTTQTQNAIINDVTNPLADNASLSTILAECMASPIAPTASDNCNGTINGISNVSFPITAQGTTIVTWTFTDVAGNITTQQQDVILNDISSPVANSVSLPDVTAECSVTPIPPKATDNCNGEIIAIPNVSFPIEAAGATVIIWTYDDGNGNTSTQTQNVIISDVSAPIPAIANLGDVNAECSITPNQPLANDNCLGSVSGISNVSFPISSQGLTVVTWSYEDSNGNLATQTQNVIINDVTAPVANITNLPNLDDCQSLTPIAPTAADACVGEITAVSDITFPITTPGNTLITWTYDDGNGNISTQEQTIIIDDIIAPVPDIANLEILEGCTSISPTSPTASDSCVGEITATADMSFPISTLGTTVVTWTYDDGNGNSSSQTQTIFIGDERGPVVDINNLPELTNCDSVTPDPPTATDNCAGTIIGTSNVSFPISSMGTTVITWTYNDGNGNSSTQTQDVSIAPIDNTVTATDGILTAIGEGDSYQWIDCSSNTPIDGATNPTFTADKTGSYAVEISNASCKVTSNCMEVIVTSLTNIEESDISIYPNPVVSELIIERKSTQKMSLTIINNTGDIVLSKSLNDKKNNIDMRAMSSGIYVLKLTIDGEIFTDKIIKE